MASYVIRHRNGNVTMSMETISRMQTTCTCIWIHLLCFILSAHVTYSVDVIYGYEDPPQNLIRNWDFEKNLSSSDWTVSNAAYEFSDDAYTGNRSILISNRTRARYAGLGQNIAGLTANKTYYMSIYIKLPDNSTTTALYYTVRLSGSYRDSDNKLVRIQMARLPYVRSNPRWRQLGGDFVTKENIPSFMFEIEVTDRAVSYLVDTTSLVEIPYDELWERRADVLGAKYRKGSITLRATIPEQIRLYCQVHFKLNQTKREFGIGSAVKADPFRASNKFGAKYRAFFTKTFQWAVFANAMKWIPMEKDKGERRFTRVDQGIAILRANNISVRGHAVLWAIKTANPGWVQPLTGQDLLDAVLERIDYVMTRYRGKIAHWDVNNENLHGRFYSAITGDPNVMDTIMNTARTKDPDGALYLNDYQAVRTGDYTSALADYAFDLISRNIPVDGMGIQSHLRSVPLQPNRIKKRLEICTETGLPITLTEVSIHTTDVDLRAWQLNVLLKTAFANPGVKGILFWQFSNLKAIGFETDQWNMFMGEEFLPNAAGQVLYVLMDKWTTQVNFTARSHEVVERVSAWQGAYDVDVYYKNQLVKRVSTYLHPGQDIFLNITLQFSDFDSIYDNDMSPCNPWTNDILMDDVDPGRNRNGANGFRKKYNVLKRAKLMRKAHVIGTRIVTM